MKVILLVLLIVSFGVFSGEVIITFNKNTYLGVKPLHLSDIAKIESKNENVKNAISELILDWKGQYFKIENSEVEQVILNELGSTVQVVFKGWKDVYVKECFPPDYLKLSNLAKDFISSNLNSEKQRVKEIYVDSHALNACWPEQVNEIKVEFSKSKILTNKPRLKFLVNGNQELLVFFNAEYEERQLFSSKSYIRGETVNPSKLLSRWVSVNEMVVDEYIDQSRLYQAKKLIEMGAKIGVNNVVIKPDLKRGDIVNVIFKRNKIRIEGQGKLVNDGFYGEKVQVLLSSFSEPVTVIINEQNEAVIDEN